MKERYETPEMEIVEFETEDIITTSGVTDPNALPSMGIQQFKWFIVSGTNDTNDKFWIKYVGLSNMCYIDAR